MNDIVRGLRKFRVGVFPRMKRLFADLASGQDPTALFITCADSRVDPSLLTQSEPGTLFVIRNAGNVVPPSGRGGEGATIEYAVRVLGVRHIIVCGHYGCGAMHALLEPDKTVDLPLVREWLRHSGEVTDEMIRAIDAIADRDLEEVAVEANVVLQLLHLQEHPAVLATGDASVALHGWAYDMRTGLVKGYDWEREVWRALNG